MSRPRRARTRAPDVSEIVWALLTDQPVSPEDWATSWECYVHVYHRWRGDLAPDVPTMQDYWGEYGDAILEDWTASQPGTRPRCWWEFSAPRWNGELRAPDPRWQVGGSGTSCHEEHPDWRFTESDFNLGIPRRLYGVRPDDPPLFEAQATYLERHGLLVPGERKRLAKADFAPVVVPAPQRVWFVEATGAAA